MVTRQTYADLLRRSIAQGEELKRVYVESTNTLQKLKEMTSLCNRQRAQITYLKALLTGIKVLVRSNEEVQS